MLPLAPQLKPGYDGVPKLLAAFEKGIPHKVAADRAGSLVFMGYTEVGGCEEGWLLRGVALHAVCVAMRRCAVCEAPRASLRCPDRLPMAPAVASAPRRHPEQRGGAVAVPLGTGMPRRTQGVAGGARVARDDCSSHTGGGVVHQQLHARRALLAHAVAGWQSCKNAPPAAATRHGRRAGPVAADGGGGGRCLVALGSIPQARPSVGLAHCCAQTARMPPKTADKRPKTPAPAPADEAELLRSLEEKGAVLSCTEERLNR